MPNFFYPVNFMNNDTTNTNIDAVFNERNEKKIKGDLESQKALDCV
jgi:hypothetical protein